MQQSQRTSAQAVQPQAGEGLDARLTLVNQHNETVFFGGRSENTINTDTVDAKGVAYVIGRTKSTDLPMVNSIQANRSRGGTGMEFLNGATVDPQGNIYVVGEAFSNFPNPTPGAIQRELSGRPDAFIIKISPVSIPSANIPVDFEATEERHWGVSRRGIGLFGTLRTGSNGNRGLAGYPGIINVPGDYDGDGKTDIAVYRGRLWLILRSSDGGVTATGWGGAAGDMPLN